MTMIDGLNNMNADMAAPTPMGRKDNSMPADEVQHKLLQMWQELLPEENVEVDLDFKTLGGDSVFAMRVISRVWDSFGVELSPGMLFDLSNIEALAQFIADKMAVPAN